MPNEEGEEIPDLTDETVELGPPSFAEEFQVLLRFLLESRSSIRLIKLFFNNFRLGFLEVLFEKSSLS
jgi:hypothetical protein